ncbi:G-coupled protein LPA1 [Pseudocowpox virus]
MHPLVIIAIIVAIICLTGAAIYLLIELGLAAERANKRARVKKNMRKIATQLGAGTLGSSVDGPFTMPRNEDPMGMSRWDSDTEDGDTVSTTSTSGGGGEGTLTHVRVKCGPYATGPMYENFCGSGHRHFPPVNDPGYHSRETLCSGPPRQAQMPPTTPKPDEVKVDVESGPGEPSAYEVPMQGPEPEQVQVEVTVSGAGGEGEVEEEFFYDE